MASPRHDASRLALIVCPVCLAEHAAHPASQVGATDLCLVCGEWWIYTAPGAVRAPTPAEEVKIHRHPDRRRITAAWKKTMRQLGMVT